MARVVRLLMADGGDYVTRTVAEVKLTFEGIEGDRQAGLLRTADARTPWHRRAPRSPILASTGSSEEVGAFGWCEGFDQATDRGPEGVDSAFGRSKLYLRLTIRDLSATPSAPP